MACSIGATRKVRAGTHPAVPRGLIAVAVVVVVWAVASQLVTRAQILPSPLAVALVLAELIGNGSLWHHLGVTLARVAASFVIALALGAALGVWMGRSRAADAWLNTLLIVALNLPALVVIVLCYIWIGLTEAAAVTAVAANKIPMVAVMLRDGARALSPPLDDMARAFRLSPLARWRHVVIPQLAPHLASAARTGMALIWKIVLVVEFLGRGDGVGFKLHMSFQLFDVKAVLAWALAFVAVMLAVDALILRPWEARASRWRRDDAA